MHEPAKPPEEFERLQELQDLCLLETPAEERYDRLTRLAKTVMGVQIALISLIDNDRQWFKSKQGLDAAETPRNISFCGHTILQDQPFVVNDAAADPRFVDNPLVVGAPFIRFYAGIPLHGPQGYRVGTLCVIDSSARTVSGKEIAILKDLAALIESEFRSTTLEQARQDLRDTQAKVSAVLERSHAELQTIIDHMPAMIGYWDTELLNRFGNKSYLEWFGFTPEQMRGKHISEILGATRYRLNLPHMEAALQGKPQMFERIIVDPRGVSRNTLASYVPDVIDGQVRGFYAFVTDVTQLRRAQEAENEAQAQLQGIIDAASEFSIIATDLSGIIRVFSKGAERMLGYRADEMIGVQTPEIIHLHQEATQRAGELSDELGHPVDGFAIYIALALRDGVDAREWTYVRKDGKHIPVIVVVTAIRDFSGEVTGFLGIANDITKQKQMQSSLVKAKEQAEAASRAKSEFLANMSHEIRTPLNAVLGMAHLLNTTALSTEQKQYLEMIRTSGQSLLSILNDILDFSKVEAGRMELAHAPFELDDVFNAVATIMTVNAGEKDLELAIGIEPGVPRKFVGDAMRLQQILVNLVANAIKFTEHGEVSVLVQTLHIEGDSALLCFRVRDSGIGMSQEQQGRLFSAFAQADASTTRRFGGTGLGLAICKSILNLMNGKIEVHSEMGKGSEFCVTLPLQLCADAAGLNQKATNLGELHLLVVEDNRTSCDYLCKTIQAWGWHVDSAESGVQAIERIKARKLVGKSYDAMLVDWQMPGMDGLATMQAIRALLPGSPAPVLIMASAFGRGKLLRVDAARQADMILIKPVTGSTLFDALHETFVARGVSSPLVQRLQSVHRRIDGISLLLVEDNPLNQIVAKGMLEQAGAVVAVAENGLKAIELLLARAVNIDLILMDVQMPVMDGFTATRKIRDELQLSMPILAMTAGVMESEQQQCIFAGMNDFIAKPIDVDQMFAAILRHWQPRAQKKAASEGSKTSSELPLEAFDGRQLAELSKINPAYRNTLFTMVRNLVERGVPKLAEIQFVYQTGKTADAKRMLHEMRGSIGTLGAKRFAAVAIELETAIHASPPLHVASLFEVVALELQQAVDSAEQWLLQQESVKSDVEK